MLPIIESSSSFIPDIPEFIWGLVFAIIGSIIIDEVFFPFVNSAKDYLKTSNNVLGNIYRFINQNLAKVFMRKESEMTKPLKLEGDEYRIFKDGEIVKCKRSKIAEFKQIGKNKFKGVVYRNNRKNEKSINVLNGYLRKNVDYLIFEEFKKGEYKESSFISTSYYYFPNDFSRDEVVGLAIENHDAKVRICISVLSFGTSRSYGKTSRVLKVIDEDYLRMFNIDLDNDNKIDETIYKLEK